VTLRIRAVWPTRWSGPSPLGPPTVSCYYLAHHRPGPDRRRFPLDADLVSRPVVLFFNVFSTPEIDLRSPPPLLCPLSRALPASLKRPPNSSSSFLSHLRRCFSACLPLRVFSTRVWLTPPRLVLSLSSSPPDPLRVELISNFPAYVRIRNLLQTRLMAKLSTSRPFFLRHR